MTKFCQVLRNASRLSCAAFAIAAGFAAHAEAAATAAVADDTDTIVVSAQRRDQSIQDVPLTVQAFSGDSLAKLNALNFNDLLKYTPNVTFANNGPGTGAIFLRGLSAGFAGNQSAASIAPFPNVALYLDEQSMQFPARNADVYLVDLQRVEVLEGPQGTLFGGGAQAGVVRYITNKPDVNKLAGSAEATFGGTASGAPNYAGNAMFNLPLIEGKLAIRAVIYGDHHGGYIDNVASNFTRSDSDSGNYYFNNGNKALPPTQQSNAGQYNNNALARKDFNPVDYSGVRLAAKWDINPDWDVLLAESYQDLRSEGTFNSLPTGSNFQTLQPLQTTVFSPAYNQDTFWNTALTVNGKIGDFKLVYAGAYLTRHISQQQDYSNYSRTGGGMYYQCTGGSTGWGTGTPFCYSPFGNWKDEIRTTHQSHELRISSPEDKRVRFIAGAYWESFLIQDIMDFNYRTIPTCTTTLISANAPCSGAVRTVPGATTIRPEVKGPNTAFGQDLTRGYDQLAFFGSADFDVLPNLTVTAGTRYYKYTDYEVGGQYGTGTGCYQKLLCPDGVNIDNNNYKNKYTGFRSKATISWKPQEGTLVYGTFSQGFRPGGYNRTAPLTRLFDANGVSQFRRPASYTPDTLTNWEVGLKTDLFDRRVQLNVSAYYMVWENVQILFFNPAGGFGNTAFVTNGANFHVKGAEVQLVARPAEGLTIDAGATFNESKQVTQPCFISNVTGSTSFGKCITTYFSGGNPITLLSPFGNIGSSLPFAPKFQGNLRARYEWQGKNDFKWFTSAGVSYTGATSNQPSTYPSGEGVLIPGTTLLRYRIPGYAVIDATAGFTKDNFTVTLFGQNLANSRASTFTTAGQFIRSEVPLRPLVYGLRVGVKF